MEQRGPQAQTKARIQAQAQTQAQIQMQAQVQTQAQAPQQSTDTSLQSMSIMRSMSAIVRHMRTYAEHSMSARGLGFPEQLVIMHLQASGQSNQDALAHILRIDKGAIAKTLGKLEEKGLIERSINPKNKREKIVSLTEDAAPVLCDMLENWKRWADAVLSGMSFEELQFMLENIESMAQQANALANDMED